MKRVLRRKYARGVILLASALVLMLFFQNCGKSAFQTSEVALNSNTELESSTPIGELPPGDEPEPEPGSLPPSPIPSVGPFRLSVAKAGSGRIISDPVGVDCGPDCNESYSSGVSVTLTASASPGFEFKGWGGACAGLQMTCKVMVKEASQVTVNFESLLPPGSVDTIISAMPANSWKSLPGTLMKDVCPTPYSPYNCEAVIAAWGGGAFDEKRDRLIVMGGGHADSWYNNVFAFDLGAMQWLRLSDMPADTGKTPPVAWNDIRLETCGYYPKGPVNIPADVLIPGKNYVDPAKCFVEPVLSQLDLQQPRSAHTYNRIFVDRLKDRYCYIASGTYPSSQAETSVINCFDPNTSLWVRIADRPKNVAGRGQTAVDAKGNVWALTDSSGPIGEYEPNNDVWKTYGSLNSNGGGGMDIDRKRHHLYVLSAQPSGSHRVQRFDLNSSNSLNAKPPFSELTTTGDAPSNLGERPGFVYADMKDQLYAWGGGRDIYTLDPVTGAWKHLTATGDDPGNQAKWGTYGRFRFSSTRGVFVVVNSTTQNVFIYKP